MAKGRLVWTEADHAEIRPYMEDAAHAAMAQYVMQARLERAKKLPADREGERRRDRSKAKAERAQIEATAAGKKLYAARRAIEKRKRAAAAAEPKAKPSPEATKRTRRIRRELGYTAADMKPAKAVP